MGDFAVSSSGYSPSTHAANLPLSSRLWLCMECCTGNRTRLVVDDCNTRFCGLLDDCGWFLLLHTLSRCHRPANVTASGPGGVIQKKSRKISNGQRGLPRRPGSSPAVEDGASQGARSSLALDWRWPLPHRTVRIVSMNSVSGSVPPVPTRSVGPVHDKRCGLRYLPKSAGRVTAEVQLPRPSGSACRVTGRAGPMVNQVG